MLEDKNLSNQAEFRWEPGTYGGEWRIAVPRNHADHLLERLKSQFGNGIPRFGSYGGGDFMDICIGDHEEEHRLKNESKVKRYEFFLQKNDVSRYYSLIFDLYPKRSSESAMSSLLRTLGIEESPEEEASSIKKSSSGYFATKTETIPFISKEELQDGFKKWEESPLEESDYLKLIEAVYRYRAWNFNTLVENAECEEHFKNINFSMMAIPKSTGDQKANLYNGQVKQGIETLQTLLFPQ